MIYLAVTLDKMLKLFLFIKKFFETMGINSKEVCILTNQVYFPTPSVFLSPIYNYHKKTGKSYIQPTP